MAYSIASKSGLKNGKPLQIAFVSQFWYILSMESVIFRPFLKMYLHFTNCINKRYEFFIFT